MLEGTGLHLVVGRLVCCFGLCLCVPLSLCVRLSGLLWRPFRPGMQPPQQAGSRAAYRQDGKTFEALRLKSSSEPGRLLRPRFSFDLLSLADVKRIPGFDSASR